MSNNFVTLMLKTVIDESQLLDFEHFTSLVLEHYSSNSRLYGRALNRACLSFPVLQIFPVRCTSLSTVHYPLKQHTPANPQTNRTPS